MKFLFLILLTFSTIETFSQKIKGIYYGEIITSKNWFVLDTNDKEVTGTVYISKTEKFNFTGEYNKPLLKGVIHLTNDKVLPIEGKRVRNSLNLFSLDSSADKKELYKLPGNVSVEDLFSEDYDPELLGDWKAVLSTDLRGVNVTNTNRSRSYGPNGQFEMKAALPSNFAGLDAKTMKALSDRLAEVNRNMINTWQTSKGHLTETYSLSGARAHSTSFDYWIRNDTLITRSSTNISYWIRK